MPWRLAGKRRDRSDPDFRFASCLVRVAMSEGADTAMALRTLEPRSDVLGDDEDTWPTQFTAEYWTSRNVFVLTTTTADGQRRAWDVWNEKTLMMNESHNLEHAKESATMSRTPFASLCARARQCHSSPRSPTYAARASPGAISRFFSRRKSPPRHAKATDAAAAPDEGPSSPGGGADESVLPVGTAGEGGLEAGESPVRPLARRREQHPPVSFIADGTASRGACFYLVAKDSCLPSRAVYKVWAARRDGFLDRLLDQRAVHDRQHFLGLRLRRRQKPRAEAGDRHDCFAHGPQCPTRRSSPTANTVILNACSTSTSFARLPT